MAQEFVEADLSGARFVRSNLSGAVLRIEQPFHPLGQTIPESVEDGVDMTLFLPGTPAYADVLAAFADRTAMVRGFVSDVTAEQLDEERPNPWAPDYAETVRACLGTILEEGWEHLRYALRDLDALAAR